MKQLTANAGWIAATLLLILLMIVLFVKSCTDPALGADQSLAAVKAEKQQVEERERLSNLKVDSIENEVARRDADIAASKVKQSALVLQLNNSNKTVSSLTAQLRKAQSDKDTLLLVKVCDSLAAISELYGTELEFYAMYVDTLISQYDAQLAAKDSIISERARLYAELRKSFNTVESEYLKINSLYVNTDKKLRQAKTWNKILGGAVIVLAGVTIAK